ncbi:MAG: IS630 family transposase [Actinobacteria bacterium]|nr:IS630 family transposase [Actinomycetota bacterium]
MAAHAKRIEIASEDRPVLEKLASSRTAERRLVERAQIVLLAAEGWPASEIAERVGCVAETARRQRARFEREGLDGLYDRPKSGRPLTHDQAARARLIALACTRPPDTEQGMRRERWTLRELAEQVGMSVSRAQTILAQADLRPHLTEQWVMSDLGPDFDAQAAEVCGLYVDPPANAIVVSVDEKTSIAAREPARPDTPPKPGRPARRDSEYLRNGTQNLFAALQVHSGEVSGMTAATRNQWDFITFLDQLDGEIPTSQQVIAVLDNLSTHKTQAVQTWLDAHPRWRFVFTPKHASWLNQVEMFFSILARRPLKHGAFTSAHDLAVQMLAFVEHYNLTAKPFAWTYTGKLLAA